MLRDKEMCGDINRLLEILVVGGICSRYDFREAIDSLELSHLSSDEILLFSTCSLLSLLLLGWVHIDRGELPNYEISS